MHDPLAHHTTDTSGDPGSTAFQVSNIACGQKHGYVSNAGGYDSGSAMQTDMT